MITNEIIDSLVKSLDGKTYNIDNFVRRDGMWCVRAAAIGRMKFRNVYNETTSEQLIDHSVLDADSRHIVKDLTDFTHIAANQRLSAKISAARLSKKVIDPNGKVWESRIRAATAWGLGPDVVTSRIKKGKGGWAWYVG